MTHLIEDHQSWALVLLFLLITVESFGVPLPGETALIAAGVLTSQGTLSTWQVIVVAAAAAIIGDNLGYWAGRAGGREIVDRIGILRRYAKPVLPRAERYFARHGGKTVFIGRFVAILRFTAAWIAGISHMDWRKFLFWNATGGVVWAVAVTLVAHYGGHAAADSIRRYGVLAAIAIAVLLVGAVLVVRRIEKRALHEDDAPSS